VPWPVSAHAVRGACRRRGSGNDFPAGSRAVSLTSFGARLEFELASHHSGLRQLRAAASIGHFAPRGVGSPGSRLGSAGIGRGVACHGHGDVARDSRRPISSTARSSPGIPSASSSCVAVIWRSPHPDAGPCASAAPRRWSRCARHCKKPVRRSSADGWNGGLVGYIGYDFKIAWNVFRMCARHLGASCASGSCAGCVGSPAGRLRLRGECESAGGGRLEPRVRSAEMLRTRPAAYTRRRGVTSQRRSARGRERARGQDLGAAQQPRPRGVRRDAGVRARTHPGRRHLSGQLVAPLRDPLCRRWSRSLPPAARDQPVTIRHLHAVLRPRVGELLAGTAGQARRSPREARPSRARARATTAVTTRRSRASCWRTRRSAPST
jgi:hypothetical protein